MLHIVNKSHSERNALASCLRLAEKGSAVLLIEDAVYAAVKGGASEGLLREALERLAVYVLAPDLEARGLNARVMDGVKAVDYGGFVDLVCGQPNCQSWL